MMYKLRTMEERADQGSAITTGNDPRIFPGGHLLRRFKIDELPQLINVAKGDMTLFGPRPEDPEIVSRWYQPWMMTSLNAAPGIIGPGSLEAFRDEWKMPAAPDEADKYYGEVMLPKKIARELLYLQRPTLSYRLELSLRFICGSIGAWHLTEKCSAREDRAAETLLANIRRDQRVQA